MHHYRGVPPDPGAVTPLGLLVAGEPRLQLCGYGVDVVGAGQRWHTDPALSSARQQPPHQVAGTLLPGAVQHRVKGFQPLPGLVRIDVRKMAGETVPDDVYSIRGTG